MKRIRGYFLLMGARHILLALIILRSVDQLSASDTMTFMVSLAPLWVWAAAMIVVGVLCIGGAVRPREMPGRLVVVASITLTIAVVGCLTAAVMFGKGVVGGYAVLLGVLAAKDYLILGLPWTDPFENITLPREPVSGVA